MVNVVLSCRVIITNSVVLKISVHSLNATALHFPYYYYSSAEQKKNKKQTEAVKHTRRNNLQTFFILFIFNRASLCSK